MIRVLLNFVEKSFLLYQCLILIRVLVRYFHCCAFLESFEICAHAFFILISECLFITIRRCWTVSILLQASVNLHDLSLLIICRMTWFISIDLIRDTKNTFLELFIYRSLSQCCFLVSLTFYERCDKISINQILERHLE